MRHGTRMFEELCFNVQLNGFRDRCVLNKTAVSDQDGNGCLSQYEPGAEVFSTLGKQTRMATSLVGHEEVRTKTIDSYVSEKEIKQIDFIKMDIEGAELLALRGAEGILRADNAPVLIVEIEDRNCEGFGYSGEKIWDYLKCMDYELYTFDHRGRISRRAEKGPVFSTNLVAMKAYHRVS